MNNRGIKNFSLIKMKELQLQEKEFKMKDKKKCSHSWN